MYKNIFVSSGFHIGIILLSIFTFPFIAKKPLDISPLVSIELIQISDTTNIPYAPKAKKIIEKIKKENEKLVSDQAPPKKIKKDKTKIVDLDKKKEKIKKDKTKIVDLDKKNEKIEEIAAKKTPTPENKKDKVKKKKLKAIPTPDKKKEKIKLEEEKKQKPSKEIKKDKLLKKIVETKKPNIEEAKVKQVSEFEKKELFDLNNIAALIDKSKEDLAETTKKTNKITQSKDVSMDSSKLTLSEEDALKAQIFTCWSVPIGLPYSEDLLVRVKLNLKPDGTVQKLEMLDHVKMNTPGQEMFRTLADSVRRAIQLCNPLKVPTSGYERWKNMILNFDARDMLGG